jgi:signal transduction histidine kinase
VNSVESILIVDDEPEILRVQRFGLQRSGYHVVTAGDADTALVRLADPDTSIDMILTDHAMPGMTGLELLQLLRKNSILIPVIIMTAFGEKKMVIEAMKSRCDGFIEKPFTMEQLIREVRRVEKSRPLNTDAGRFRRLFPRLLHQINNPLMAISGHAETSLYSPDTPRDLKKKFETIVKSVDQIKALNRQILMVGAAGSDHKARIDLIEVIDESLHLFEGVTAGEQIDVRKTGTEKEVMVLGNRRALAHVFNNLLQNAIHAVSGQKTRRIRVAVTSAGRSPAVRIAVEDTGYGISESDLPKIFDPYFTSKKNGTGLGLAIVKEIVESHDGGITVCSNEGTGACFMIELPAAAEIQEKSEYIKIVK